MGLVSSSNLVSGGLVWSNSVKGTVNVMPHASAVRGAVHAALVRDDRLPPGPCAIFAALYQAGPEGVPEDDLIRRARWGDATSFHRVLQGTSRRIRNRTAGTLGYEALIAKRSMGVRLHWSLTPEARAAIDDVPALRRVLEMPVADILATRNPDDPQRDKSRWLRL
jgi:hypothetical protein